jgi:hypothetical protein
MTQARTTSPMTRNQRRKSSEIPSEVKLWKIVPEVPRNETKQGELLEDLQTWAVPDCWRSRGDLRMTG